LPLYIWLLFSSESAVDFKYESIHFFNIRFQVILVLVTIFVFIKS